MNINPQGDNYNNINSIYVELKVYAPTPTPSSQTRKITVND